MSGLPLCLRNSLPACVPDLITCFHPAIACKGSSKQQVPRQMSRISHTANGSLLDCRPSPKGSASVSPSGLSGGTGSSGSQLASVSESGLMLGWEVKGGRAKLCLANGSS